MFAVCFKVPPCSSKYETCILSNVQMCFISPQDFALHCLWWQLRCPDTGAHMGHAALHLVVHADPPVGAMPSLLPHGDPC